MANNTHDIIVFGEGGDWLEKNRDAIEARFDTPQYVGKDNWQEKADQSQAATALIMTPPHTHKEICQQLLKNNAIKKIYCEKPFLDIADLFDNIDDENDLKRAKEKIRVIDHYLLKNTGINFTELEISLGKNKAWRLAQRYLGRWYSRPGAYNPLTTNSYAKSGTYITHSFIYLITFLFRFFTYITGWIPVKYIEIDIEEKKETDKEEEPRQWMKEKDKFGGVVNDLGHHALAILLRMFGKKALGKVIGKDITILKVRYFDEATKNAIAEINFLILLGRCTIRINVAKGARNTSKKISLYRKFMTHAKPNQEYDLTEPVQTKRKTGYDYGENFDNGASCLTYEEVQTINKVCQRVSDLAHQMETEETEATQDRMGLINTLTDQFKHRHTFYWQSYYKLVVYQIFILLTPYVFAINLDDGKAGIAYTILFLTLIISLWIYYWGVQKVTAVLSEEHIRMKVVHDRLKDLLKTIRVDLSVISINESSISDVMQTQYRFLIRGLCFINPIVIYYIFQEEINEGREGIAMFFGSLF